MIKIQAQVDEMLGKLKDVYEVTLEGTWGTLKAKNNSPISGFMIELVAKYFQIVNVVSIDNVPMLHFMKK